MKTLLKTACKKFGGNYHNAKLYNKDGVCLFDEDVKNVVTSGDILYVAVEGENFNYCAILDEYELGRTLGEGGFGKVILGKHKETKEKVAIKFSDMSSELGSASAIQAIYKEAESLKALVHKHIIKLHHAFLEGKQFIMIMEAAMGGELKDYIRANETVSEKVARSIIL